MATEQNRRARRANLAALPHCEKALLRHQRERALRERIMSKANGLKAYFAHREYHHLGSYRQRRCGNRT